MYYDEHLTDENFFLQVFVISFWALKSALGKFPDKCPFINALPTGNLPSLHLWILIKQSEHSDSTTTLGECRFSTETEPSSFTNLKLSS